MLYYYRGNSYLWVDNGGPGLRLVPLQYYICSHFRLVFGRRILSRRLASGTLRMLDQYTLFSNGTVTTLWSCRICQGAFVLQVQQWSRVVTLCCPNTQYVGWKGHLFFNLRSAAGAFSIYSWQLRWFVVPCGIPRILMIYGCTSPWRQWFVGRAEACGLWHTYARICLVLSLLGWRWRAFCVGWGGYPPCCQYRAMFAFKGAWRTGLFWWCGRKSVAVDN